MRLVLLVLLLASPANATMIFGGGGGGGGGAMDWTAIPNFPAACSAHQWMTQPATPTDVCTQPTLADIAAGTAPAGAFHIGTGASLDATGSGTITATAIPNGTDCSSPNFALGVDGAGNATCASTAHILLDGTFNSDALNGSVARGAVIVGNSTPKWAKLTIGAANRYLSSDGTDATWGQVNLASGVTGLLPNANLQRQPHYINVADYCTCDALHDDTACIATALTAATGGVLWVPSGCKLGLANPGDGNASVTIPTDTDVQCEDNSSGFWAQSRRCSAASNISGAACSADSDCNTGGAGTCDPDFGATTYTAGTISATMVTTAASSRANRVQGCSFWTNQTSASRSVYVGGNTPNKPELFYTCVATGGRSGLPCEQHCVGSGAPGGKSAPSWGCNADADCTGIAGCGATCAAWTCTNRATCASAGGTTPNCYTSAGTPGTASGPGNIVALDLSNSGADSTIYDVQVLDHRKGTAAIKGGSNTFIRRVRPTENTGLAQHFNGSTFGFPAEPAPTGWNVTAVVNGGASVVDSAFLNGIYQVYTAGNTYLSTAASELIRGNTFSFSGTTGTTDVPCIAVNSAQTNIIANFFNACYIGVVVNVGTGGFNTTIAANRIYQGAGPKVIMASAGNIVEGNYLAWETTGSHGVIEIGDSRSGQSAAMTGHGAIRNNVIHTNRTAYGIVVNDIGKRCQAGSRLQLACTVDGDCTGGGAGSCQTNSMSDTVVANNTFIGVSRGIDLSQLTTGNTLIPSGDLTIQNNYMEEVLTDGIYLPASGTDVGQIPVIGNEIRATTPVHNYAEGTMFLEGNVPPTMNKQFDIDTSCDNATFGAETTVATLTDYDNVSRNTFLSGCVTVGAVGAARNVTLRIKLEGSTVYTGVSDVVSAKSLQMCGQFLDTTSAAARTAIMTLQADGGTTNTAANCSLSRSRS